MELSYGFYSLPISSAGTGMLSTECLCYVTLRSKRHSLFLGFSSSLLHAQINVMHSNLRCV